jgi:hypothetical protein
MTVFIYRVITHKYTCIKFYFQQMVMKGILASYKTVTQGTVFSKLATNLI